jgi:Tfp pilus assembly protein PilX
MKNKLAIALINQSNQKGFALPIAMGMGLFLLLIATIMMFKSQSDRVSAASQKATTQSLSAAETGVTRYQYLINNNRAIAPYPDCAGTRNSSGTCPDSGSTKSWANATSISGLNSCSGGNPTNVSNNSLTQWQDVDSSDSSKGQYRLVTYSYLSDAGSGISTPGTGILTIEGRVNQNGSGSSATKDVGTASTRLQVKIPVRSGQLENIPVPGLWLTSGNAGGNTIDGNVLLNDCSVSLGSINMTATNSVTGEPNTKSYTSLRFPSLPAKPTFISSPNNQVLGTIDSSTMAGLGAISIGGSNKRLTLPRSGDTTNSSGFYEYSVSSIDLPNNSELVITPGQKVRFYLDNGIDDGGNIIHNCTGVSNCKPTDFQIWGYGASGTEICMNGNNYVEAFIFAPDYAVGVAGSGGGTGGVKGSVWTKDWSNGGGCGSNTSNIVLVQTASWNDMGLTPSYLSPSLGEIGKWERQEVQ